MSYGTIQSPNWTRKHSYILLNLLMLIFLTFLPVIVAMANGPIDVAGTYTSYGLPFLWLQVKIGVDITYRIISLWGLLLDLSFNLVVSTILIYPRKVAQFLMLAWK